MVEAPETGVINGWELPCGCWDLNVGLLHDQQVLFRVEPSLQALKESFLKKTSNRKTNEDKETPHGANGVPPSCVLFQTCPPISSPDSII